MRVGPLQAFAVLFVFRSLALGTSVSAAEADQAKAADAKPTAAGIEFFEAKIRPVLVAQCYECHSAGAKQMKGGLVLDTRAGVRKGGESGPAVVPGNPKDSPLIEAIRREGLEMPPKGPLPENVVADFVKWVEMGAPDPREGKTLAASKIDVAAGKKHWAYQPIGKSAVPQVKDAAWPRSDLDRFVLAGLEAKKLQPVGDADPIAWLRRVTLDLIGLPPTPEEMEAFLNDIAASPRPRISASRAIDTETGRRGDTENAYAKVVDRLLASPQFGERWGRHWLDVARYGESTGKERNVPYPAAWRYRDYVIDSFNADKPYDRFITEQVAGDLLETKTPVERNENLIATGFLALGPKSLNNRNEAEYLLDIADEQIDVVCRAVMATTAQCARCHDHKFDPIPQTDYYALAGIFRSTDVLAGVQRQGRSYQSNQFMTLMPSEGNTQVAAAPKPATEPAKPATANLKPAERARLKEELAAIERQLDELRKQRQAGSKSKAQVKEQARRLESEKQRLEAALNGKNNRNAPAEAVDLTNLAMGVKEGKAADIELRIRGEVADLGPVVPRGFLSVLQSPSTPKIDPAHSGRRELAQWLTADDNPLTARVMANRVWFHLFGSGLVETIDNFGALGDKPSNPELLDHLARQFRDGGWSVKSLIRSIVLSRAYGLSSEHQDAAYAVDPANRLVWRMNRRRLDAEVIRDSALAAAGTLDLTRPPPPVGTQQNGEIGRNLSAEATKANALRRSVYLPSARGLTNEMLALFDAADNSLVVGQREVTTVATQALFLLNSPFILEQSDGTAARVLASSESESARRADLMYRLILARPATEHETARAVDFVRTFQPQSNDAQAAWSALAQVLFSSAEFRYAY